LQSLDNSTSGAQRLMDAFIKNRGTQWDKEVSYLDDMAKVTKAELVAVVNKYLNDKDLGFNKEQVVVVQTHKQRKQGLPLAELYRTELLKHPEIADAAVSVYSLNETPWVGLGFTDEKKVYHSFQYNAVDPYWLPLMKIEAVQGRLFSANNPGDEATAAVVNEAFLQEFHLTDPIGKKLPGKFEQQIIGVVRDFNMESLHTKVKPLMMTISPDSVFRRTENVSINQPPQPRISVRLRAGNLATGVHVLQEAWKKVAPNQDFDYRFLDESIEAQYEAEKRTNLIVRIASLLSIVIACLGLFGLATLAVVRRTKEIGIRKVLGANVTSLVALLSRDFIKLVSIAAVIAFPLAWWFINNWLKDFEYRINIQWWVFVIAALLVMFLTVLTVGIQAVRAALANPVKSLRTE